MKILRTKFCFHLAHTAHKVRAGFGFFSQLFLYFLLLGVFFLCKSNITSSLGALREILLFPRVKLWGSLPDVLKLKCLEAGKHIDKGSDRRGVILEFNASSCEKSVCVSELLTNASFAYC